MRPSMAGVEHVLEPSRPSCRYRLRHVPTLIESTPTREAMTIAVSAAALSNTMRRRRPGADAAS